ncbi:MAG: hypothetical protein AAGJ32_00580 [Pseudomonadota bacterium]
MSGHSPRARIGAAVLPALSAMLLALTACQSNSPQSPSTQTPSPQSSGPLPAVEQPASLEESGDAAPQVASPSWTLADDDTATHVQSGGVCPATVGAFARFGLPDFRPNGLDVGCQYETADQTGILTLYFSDFAPMTAEQHLGQMIQVAEITRGLGLDRDGTKACQDALILRVSAETGDAAVEAPACAVLSNDDAASLILVETFGRWHFKIRLTQPGTVESALGDMVSLAGDLLFLQTGAIGERQAQTSA